jgi:hypothetical protein
MTRTDRKMTARVLDLVLEFQRYVLRHPGRAAKIPNGTVVVLQVKGDEEFNRWSCRLGEKQARAERRPIVHITLNKMGPVRSVLKP